MKRIRKICVILIVVCYLCGTVPALMGCYNRLETILGIPLFILGLLSMAFGMLLTLTFLYIYEEHHEGGDET